jgi:hypothetical protein
VLIVGVLIIIIIVCAGWLIFYYTKLTYIKAKVEDGWEQLTGG